MELRTYWKILLRRWPYVIIPAVVVLVVGLATYRPPATTYNVGVRFMVSQPPALEANESDQERYYNWLTSEYIVNALTDWVQGHEFGQAVSAELQERGLQVPPGAIQGGLVADNARSLFTLSLVHSDPELLVEMMDAAIVVLQERNTDVLPQLGDSPARLVPLDEPVVSTLPTGIRSQLELPVRILAALVAGLGLAFLIEYLDPTVRDRTQLEEMGLSILGEIPKK